MGYLKFEKVNISGADEHPSVNGEYIFYPTSNGFPSYRKIIEHESEVFIYCNLYNSKNTWFISTKFMDADAFLYVNNDSSQYCPAEGK